eukprot:gnl/Dysnectes_brevis/1567_a1777_2256.p1 GENE.gnl/Dysnectes_brevis/1567_a1777_2256~~gnl/Dysnectes_brevis/1567_a1777_2256.p1  ORF type:complete len:152 (+),score=19.30 gnl/Dysnectes_brevis/1567_a1777_2256:28-456(+)
MSEQEDIKFMSQLVDEVDRIQNLQGSISEEVADLSQLKEYIHAMKSRMDETDSKGPFHTKTHLGANIFADTVVLDPNNILSHIGAGIFLECTLDEAHQRAEKRLGELKVESRELINHLAQVRSVAAMHAQLSRNQAQDTKPR